MMYDITPIVNGMLAVLGALVTCILIPYIKSKTTAEQQKNLMDWVRIGVQAAEMLYKHGNGAEKLQYVIDFLESKGFKIELDEIQPIIESAVLELKADGKEAKMLLD